MKTINIIAAVSHAGIIGIDGDIPWHIPEDLKRFKALTLNKTVIMGRKTFESIGMKPLPNRANIVISSTPIEVRGVRQVNTPAQALELAYTMSNDIFIIGGERVYKYFLPKADNIYLTEVFVYGMDDSMIISRCVDNVAFFPFEAMPEEGYDVTTSNTVKKKGVNYRFVTYSTYK